MKDYENIPRKGSVEYDNNIFRSSSISGLVAMAALMEGMMGNSGGSTSALSRDLERRFCSLPACKKEYRHKGNYCCKEHFLDHRQELKKST